MKYLMISVLLIMSLIPVLNASELSWNDLENYNQYYSNQAISFPGVVDIAAGEKFELREILGGNNTTIFFQFHLVNCTLPYLESELVIQKLMPVESFREHFVGLKLEQGCNISMWVEARDFYTYGLFSTL
jgi:hypothetical protein